MQKNHLEYSPGATTFRLQHRSRVAGPVDATGEGQSSQSEKPAPSERFQNAGRLERDGFRKLRRFRPQSERKPDIALENSRKKLLLVLAGRMIWCHQRRARWTAGETRL